MRSENKQTTNPEYGMWLLLGLNISESEQSVRCSHVGTQPVVVCLWIPSTAAAASSSQPRHPPPQNHHGAQTAQDTGGGKPHLSEFYVTSCVRSLPLLRQVTLDSHFFLCKLRDGNEFDPGDPWITHRCGLLTHSRGTHVIFFF